MKGHLELVPLAEIGHGIFRPLVGLGQKHAVLKLAVDMSAQLFYEGMVFRQIFATGALALVKIRHGIDAEPIDAHG